MDQGHHRIAAAAEATEASELWGPRRTAPSPLRRISEAEAATVVPMAVVQSPSTLPALPLFMVRLPQMQEQRQTLPHPAPQEEACISGPGASPETVPFEQ